MISPVMVSRCTAGEDDFQRRAFRGAARATGRKRDCRVERTDVVRDRRAARILESVWAVCLAMVRTLDVK